MPPKFTVPGMSQDDADKVIDLLQGRLVTLTDLQLTLKHIHWNVVGPHFIAVHEMLDPQVDAVPRWSTTSPSGSPPWAARPGDPRRPGQAPGRGTTTPSVAT